MGPAGVFGAALLALGVGYAAFMAALAVGFQRAVRRERIAEAPPGPPSAWPFVSVVVPARDESATIEACLAAIFAGDYPPERFEVLVVDDLSEDDTAAIVARVIERVNTGRDPGAERLRLFRVADDLERTRAHKKRAIERGIAEARGALILTTDADCAPPPGWIRRMAAAFDDVDQAPDTGQGVVALISGPVLYRPGDRPLLHMQALEFLGLVAVGAGSIGIGRPTLCNGANVAYRRDVFAALGGFAGIDHLTSGDDELLMQKVAYGTRHRVRFQAAREAAAVLTDPVHSFRAFFEQRRRWASKGAHYPNRALVALNVAIYLFYLGLLGGALAAPFVAAVREPLIVAFGLKLISEALLLAPAAVHYGRWRLLIYFVPEQALHVPYIVVLAAAGALGGYTWKGRTVAR